MAVTLKWFPPAWVQIRTDSGLFYVDPAYLRTYFARHPGRIELSRWPDPIDGLPEELDAADAILVTHAHKDHCKAVTVNRLRKAGTQVIAPERCAAELGPEIRVVAAGDELQVGGARVRVVPAYNTPQGSSTRKAHPKGRGVGYVIEVGGRRIYHAGDTDRIAEMADLGPVDVALLPVGGTFTMDASEAAEAARLIRPRAAIPIHFLKTDPRAFRRCLGGVPPIDVPDLGIGEPYRVA